MTKYYTICYPGEFGQHVQETFSEMQILKSYFDYWSMKMREANKAELISIESCIDDWIVVNWAWETDQYGGAIDIPSFEEYQ